MRMSNTSRMPDKFLNNFEQINTVKYSVIKIDKSAASADGAYVINIKFRILYIKTKMLKHKFAKKPVENSYNPLSHLL